MRRGSVNSLARDAVQDATPAGLDGRDYDAAMRTSRPALLLLAIAIALLGGCALGLKPTASLPASFTEDYVRAEGMTFTAAQPPVPADAIVAALRDQNGQRAAVPFFGVLSCTGAIEGCQPGPGGFMGSARTVWVVIYPDWTGRDGDVAWVVVDAITGLDNGTLGHDPEQ